MCSHWSFSGACVHALAGNHAVMAATTSTAAAHAADEAAQAASKNEIATAKAECKLIERTSRDVKGRARQDQLEHDWMQAKNVV